MFARRPSRGPSSELNTAVRPSVHPHRAHVTEPTGGTEREAEAAARQALSGAVREKPVHGGGSAGSVSASTVMTTPLDPGRPLDGATRRYFEPRFSHDFSRVRVHTDEKACASARELRAHAYTVGPDIVFAPGRYMPSTPAGKRLLGHELAHVVQSESATHAPRTISRLPADLPFELDEDQRREYEIYEYQSYLNQHEDIEGMPASGFMALALARRRIQGEALLLPENGDALLIIEMLHIAPTQEQRNAALTLLRQMETSDLQNMLTREPGSSPGKINMWELAGKFEGIQLHLVLDILSTRFEGGFDELLRGKDPLQPVQTSELENRTLDWLKNNRQTAEEFFDKVWSAHRIVMLGETHYRGPQQRSFAAAMLKRHGGPNVTLALETKMQEPVDQYLKNRDPKVFPDWFTGTGYHTLIDAARSSGTHVSAVDIELPSDIKPLKPLKHPSYNPERDLNMAAGISVAQAKGHKVLFYGGANHVREGFGHHDTPLGRWLADSEGSGSYSIVMEFEDSATNQFFSKIQKAFPAMPSFGFDVDKSPLRWANDPDVHKEISRSKNLDGYIYFLKSSS